MKSSRILSRIIIIQVLMLTFLGVMFSKQLTNAPTLSIATNEKSILMPTEEEIASIMKEGWGFRIEGNNIITYLK